MSDPLNSLEDAWRRVQAQWQQQAQNAPPRPGGGGAGGGGAGGFGAGGMGRGGMGVGRPVGGPMKKPVAAPRPRAQQLPPLPTPPPPPVRSAPSARRAKPQAPRQTTVSQGELSGAAFPTTPGQASLGSTQVGVAISPTSAIVNSGPARSLRAQFILSELLKPPLSLREPKG